LGLILAFAFHSDKTEAVAGAVGKWKSRGLCEISKVVGLGESAAANARWPSTKAYAVNLKSAWGGRLKELDAVYETMTSSNAADDAMRMNCIDLSVVLFSFHKLMSLQLVIVIEGSETYAGWELFYGTAGGSSSPRFPSRSAPSGN
jgi:hypothetical protein